MVSLNFKHINYSLFGLDGKMRSAAEKMNKKICIYYFSQHKTPLEKLN
jgi:hypothetical protein